MKTIKVAMWCLLALAAIGYVGRCDYQMARLEEASAICQNEVPMQPCINNQLEDNNDK